jgi:ribosomal protein L14E/L6E/L27E
MNELPCIGSVVISKAGRDAERFFVVIAHSDDKKHVLVADGALRKVDNPKRKKLKHISIKDVIIPVIKETLEAGEKVYDYELRSHLNALGYNS